MKEQENVTSWNTHPNWMKRTKNKKEQKNNHKIHNQTNSCINNEHWTKQNIKLTSNIQKKEKLSIETTKEHELK